MSPIDFNAAHKPFILGSPIQVVIPAGGSGTRLASLTTKVPKALLPVNGKPFLHLVANWLVRQGVRQVHLCLGQFHEQILLTLPDLPTALDVTYSVEDKPRGVAGALLLAENYLADKFILLFGDVFPRIALSALVSHFADKEYDGVLTVVPEILCHEKANVCLQNGRVLQYVSKADAAIATHLDVGITVFRRTAIRSIPGNRFVSEKEWYQNLARQGVLGAFESDQPP